MEPQFCISNRSPGDVNTAAWELFFKNNYIVLLSLLVELSLQCIGLLRRV